MTLLPLDRIRLDTRSHRAALQWIGLAYRRPKEVKAAEKHLQPWKRVTTFLRIYVHALPYVVLVCGLGRLFLAEISRFIGGAALQGQEFTFWLVAGLCSGLAIGIAFSVAGVLPGLAVGLGFSLAFGTAYNLPFVASSLSLVLFGAISFSMGIEGTGDLISTLGFALMIINAAMLVIGLSGRGFFLGFALGFVFIFFFFRLYYIPFYFLWLRSRVLKEYRLHPVAWDDICLLPFPCLDQALVAYAERDPEAGKREIDRLIDEYVSQRGAALRAQATLIARFAAKIENLTKLDESLVNLPGGEEGFLAETSELRHRVHEISVLQTRLDTLNRPFMREPFAALLVKEIETFEQRIGGFRPPLATEFRKAARQWLVIARRQLDAVRGAATREPTHQVFRAGDPVDCEREAFVLRGSILGEFEQQVMLATGCPGLIVYGRRRMGKSTLLRNLGGLLPPRMQVVTLSMQDAHAFTSLPYLVRLIIQRVTAALPGTTEPTADLTGLQTYLDATQKLLEAGDRRLLLAIDEYENLDSKIGENVLPEDLLAVMRESIQTHRRIIWIFAGSHGIDELVHAPWTSYLVSARTLEVTPFEPAETRLLLTEPLKHSTLWRHAESERPRFEPGFWGDGGIERIHAEAGGWPHLVQLIAQTVVDLVNDSGGISVNDALLERALDRSVVLGNNVFLELLERESRLPGEWDYLRVFRNTEEQPPPADVALARSLRRRLLVVEEQGKYRLRVPLMARWLRERI
jgi:hypothetical protein